MYVYLEELGDWACLGGGAGTGCDATNRMNPPASFGNSCSYGQGSPYAVVTVKANVVNNSVLVDMGRCEVATGMMSKSLAEAALVRYCQSGR